MQSHDGVDITFIATLAALIHELVYHSGMQFSLLLHMWGAHRSFCIEGRNK